jgi:hypothetical protein
MAVFPFILHQIVTFLFSSHPVMTVFPFSLHQVMTQSIQLAPKDLFRQQNCVSRPKRWSFSFFFRRFRIQISVKRPVLLTNIPPLRSRKCPSGVLNEAVGSSFLFRHSVILLQFHPRSTSVLVQCLRYGRPLTKSH